MGNAVRPWPTHFIIYTTDSIFIDSFSFLFVLFDMTGIEMKMSSLHRLNEFCSMFLESYLL